MSRRRFLAATLGLAAVGVAGRMGWQQLAEDAERHPPYFRALADALADANTHLPRLVVDWPRAQNNLLKLLAAIQPDYHYRIVVKSLPCLPLIDRIMEQASTRRLMVFNEPSVRVLANERPTADLLLGKPLPAAAAHYFYQHRNPESGFNPAQQLQWLVDSPQRLDDYRQLAESLNEPLRINLEINIGLNRGGLASPSELDAVLAVIQDHPLLTFSGFMGYEAHIVKAPGPASFHFERAMTRYQAFVERAETLLGKSIRNLTLNTGGSTTASLYREADVAPNEIAAGSAVLQPAGFDLHTLADQQPAVFITTPVLKRAEGLALPGAPGAGTLLGLWDRRYETTFFIDRGNWKAEPVSPPGLRLNPLYGRSSNQEMLNGPDSLALTPGDTVFLRPIQSERLLEQFGPLLMFNGQRITSEWPVFATHPS
ncbi:alanine racemase [Halomonadaceae bacterium KBTZ08]